MASAFAALLLSCSLVSVAAAADWAGSYKSATVSLELTRDANGYAGTLLVGGKSYPVRAQEAANGSLEGSFPVGASTYPFQATLAGEAMTLKSGASTYELKRSAVALQPPQQVGPATNPTPVNAPATTVPATTAPARKGPTSGPPNDPKVLESVRDLGKPKTDPKREWLILVYIAGDNDLEPNGVLNIDQMERGLPESGVDVVVLYDREIKTNKAGEAAKPRLYHITRDRKPGSIDSDVLREFGLINTADPKLLSAFVEGAVKAYPAKQHAFFSWDHGGGWASLNSDWHVAGSDQRTIMSMPEFHEGLAVGMRAAGLKKWEFLGMDMCLMCQLEVATELQDLTDVLVASEELVPGKGMPYDRVLQAFGKGTMGGRRIAQEIVVAFDQFHKEDQRESTTLAALDLTLVGDVNSKLNAICDKLTPAMDQKWTALSRSFFYCEQYTQERDDFRKGVGALQTVDLLDALKKCRAAMPDFPAETEYTAFVNAMDRFVIANANSRRRRLSNGLAIYAPVIRDVYDPRYDQLKFATISHWPKLVQAMYPAQARDVQAPKFGRIGLVDPQGIPVQGLTPLNGESMSIEVTGKNMVWVREMGGIRDPQAGGVRILGSSYIIDANYLEKLAKGRENFSHDIDVIMPQLTDGLNRLRQPALGVFLRLTDGRTSVEVMIDGSDLSAPTEFLVPVQIEDARFRDGKVSGFLSGSLLDMGVHRVVVTQVQPGGRRTLTLLEPAADTRITPVFDVIHDDGTKSRAAKGAIAWGEGLEFVVDTLAPGEYEDILVAETMGGLSSTARFRFRVLDDERLTALKESWRDIKPSRMVGTWEWMTTGDQVVSLKTTMTIEATKLPWFYRLTVTGLGPDGRPVEMTGTLMLRMEPLPFYHMVMVLPGSKQPPSGLMGPMKWVTDGHGDRVMAMLIGPNKAIYWVKTKEGAPGRENGPQPQPPVQRPPEGWIAVTDANRALSVAVPPTFVVMRDALQRNRQVFAGYDFCAADGNLGIAFEIIRFDGVNDPDAALKAMLAGGAQLGVQLRPGQPVRSKMGGADCVTVTGQARSNAAGAYVFVSNLITTPRGIVAVNFAISPQAGDAGTATIEKILRTVQVGQ
jgi:hypothetical protein